MAFTGVFPVQNAPLNTPVALLATASLGPQGPAGTTQQQISGTSGIANRSITWPNDRVTVTSGGITATINPSMQDPSSYIGQLNAAGIPCTIDVAGRLVFTAASAAPTSSDANALKVLGVT